MSDRQGTSFMLLALYALLIAAQLVLVVFGAKLYGTAEESRNRHADQRSALAFIQSQINGESCGVSLREGPEGDMLCLAEPDSSFETRIYLYDHALRTQLCGRDGTFAPETGDRICPLEDFSLDWASENLLRIRADGSEAWAHCGGGEIGG